MKSYNIDEETKFLNIEIHNAIKLLIHKKDIDIFSKVSGIAYFIKHITDSNLLNNTIKLLKETNYLQYEEKISIYLKPIISNLIYSENDIVRIRAIVFSGLLTYELKKRFYNFLHKEDVLELRYYIKERYVSHNVDSLFRDVKKKSIEEFYNYIQETQFEKKENEYKKMIVAMAKINYEEDTNYFIKEIDYLTVLKENIPEIKVSFNQKFYFRIFTSVNAHRIFKHFTEKIKEKTIIADYSFIFRIMQKDDLIYKTIRNTEYIEWLNNEFGILLDKVKTLNDCKTTIKEQLYTTLKNQYKD